MLPRCVLVERATDYQLLLARHGTREQVRFFLAQRGEELGEVEQHDAECRQQRARVLGAIPEEWRRTTLHRSDLDRFLFEPDDVIVVLGQDGLVANVAKYLEGQPVIGLNPEPDHYPGVLVPHSPEAAGELLRDVARGTAHTQRRTMVEALVDDGQRLLALNEIFIGHVSHQSARYEISYRGVGERQSSSGVVIATGSGATGWAASLHRERHSSLEMPGAEELRLAFFVREAWPSVATGVSVTEGLLDAKNMLGVRCENGEGGVLFGDGIETDRVALDWGQRVTMAPAKQALMLVSG